MTFGPRWCLVFNICAASRPPLSSCACCWKAVTGCLVTRLLAPCEELQKAPAVAMRPFATVGVRFEAT